MKLKQFEKKIKKLGYSIEISHKGNLKVVSSEGKLILTVVVSKPMHYVKGSNIGRVIRLHMVNHQIIRQSVAQNGVQILQPFLGADGLQRLDLVLRTDPL